MIFTGRRLVPLLAMTVAICPLAVGCGDESNGDPRAETPAAARAPDAKQSPEAFARDLAELVANTTRRKDCKPLDAINARSFYRFPCPSLDSVRTEMTFLKVLNGATYGTGAVLEYKSGETPPGGGTMVLFLAPNREWGLSRFNLITESSADSSDEDSRAGYERTATGYLRAIRERDCKGYTDYAAIQSRTPAAACKRELPATEPIARILRANPDSKPQYLGGSKDFGFFSLELEEPKPAYYTMGVFKTPDGSLRPFLVQFLTFAPPPVEG